MNRFSQPRRSTLHFFMVILALALCQLGTQKEASGSVVLAMTLEDLARQADIILLGKCERIYSEWGPERKDIFTYIAIIPEQCLKGKECPPQVIIRQLGGRVDNIALTVPGTPRFHLDERVLVFLQMTSASQYIVIGLSQGKYGVVTDAKDGKSYVTRDLNNLSLVKKRDEDFYIKKANSENEKVVLETFIEEIRSYLDF